MARLPYLSALLGGIQGGAAGATQGLQMDAARRRQATLDQWQTEDHTAQTALRNAEAQKLRDAATQQQTRSQAIATHWAKAVAGDPNSQAALISAAPDLAARFQAPDKPDVPHTITGSDGRVFQYDDKAKAWKLAAGTTGDPIAGKGTPPKNIDPLSPEGIAARVALAKQVAAAKPKVATPDQVRMKTVDDLAGPAADALAAYHANAGSFSETAAAAAGHIPLVGKAAANYFDEPFQTAQENARVLATQYLEAMPKSRFQPSTVDDVAKQIAPHQGDSPLQRKQKAARVMALKKAIHARAMNPTDLPGITLDDAPPPPDL